MDILVTVLAHNEERRIGACLRSLLAEPGDFPIHVVVNGSSDGTAEIAGGFGARVTVHEYRQGGKSRSWNRFLFEDLKTYADAHVFIDGDAEITGGSIAALAGSLAGNRAANAISAVPLNGRSAPFYRSEMVRTHGLFGDLYALRGSFLARMNAAGILLPDDLIGDDSLVGALAKTDLDTESDWRDERIVVCETARFICEPVKIHDPDTWNMQYNRMVNYSLRHFQNIIVSDIMKTRGPKALPRNLATLYPEWLPLFTPRSSGLNWWFDRRALAKMRNSAKP